MDAAHALAEEPAFDVEIERPDVPLLAVALHDGHAVRPQIAELLAIDERARLREEDPMSREWTALAPNRIVARRSRFEVDLNRAPEEAVYPARVWELDVWRSPPSRAIVARSVAIHTAFYRTVREVIASMARPLLVLDLHSYNHRRGDRPDDARLSPELNLGTGSLDRRFRHVAEAFSTGARAARIPAVDVRENVRFRGGWFPSWVNTTFPNRACALAIEVKKTFMDERTGAVDLDRVIGWREIIKAGAAAALEVLIEDR